MDTGTDTGGDRRTDIGRRAAKHFRCWPFFVVLHTTLYSENVIILLCLKNADVGAANPQQKGWYKLMLLCEAQEETKRRKPRIAKKFESIADLPVMLSVYDLVDFLKCGQKQAYELTHSVGFPSLKIGATIQTPKHLFIKWLEDQTKGQLL